MASIGLVAAIKIEESLGAVASKKRCRVAKFNLAENICTVSRMMHLSRKLCVIEGDKRVLIRFSFLNPSLP